MASDWNPPDWTSTTTPRPRRRLADGYGLPREYGPGSRWYEPDLEEDYHQSAEWPVYVPDRESGPDLDDYPEFPSAPAAEPAVVPPDGPVGTKVRPAPAPRPPARAPSLLGLKLVVAAMAVALLGASGGLVVAWVRAEPAPQAQQLTLAAAEDTYFVEQEPGADHSTAPELLVANRPDVRAIAYLKFEVPELPQQGRIVGARLETRSSLPQPAGIQVFHVADTTWVASELKDSGAPARGDQVANGATAAGSTSLSFDLSRVINTPSRTYAFALDLASAGAKGQASIFASERGDQGPRLTVTWTPLQARGDTPPQAMLQPGYADPASPQPTALPSAHASFGAPPVRPAPAGRRLLAGASIQLRTGETFAQGLARADRTYGPLEMARVFYPGLPPAWPGSRADVAGRTVVVSFKASPRDINTGRHDAGFASWFASIPRTRDTYWVYYHEPEDNITSGDFTAAEYRAAWRRLAGLADRAGNSRLRATLVLMCYSLNPSSGRNWRDYYPGDDVIDALGWDCYNFGAKKGEYASPASIFAKSIEVSRAAGKPFGYAETGSTLVGSDPGPGRAAWLRAVGEYLNSQNALWAAYFDVMLSVDYRLLDQASQQAWMSVCRS